MRRPSPARRIERGRWHRGLAVPVQAEHAHGSDALDQADQVPSRGRTRRLAQPRDPGRPAVGGWGGEHLIQRGQLHRVHSVD